MFFRLKLICVQISISFDAVGLSERRPEEVISFFLTLSVYHRWRDKTSYLKNVKSSGEPKNMAALTL